MCESSLPAFVCPTIQVNNKSFKNVLWGRQMDIANQQMTMAIVNIARVYFFW